MGYGYGSPWGMMGGWGGYGAFGMIIWVIILVAIIALVVWLVRSLATFIPACFANQYMVAIVILLPCKLCLNACVYCRSHIELSYFALHALSWWK